jgi:hypothetical protein
MIQARRLLFTQPAIHLMAKDFFINMAPHLAIKYPERFKDGYGPNGHATISTFVCCP